MHEEPFEKARLKIFTTKLRIALRRLRKHGCFKICKNLHAASVFLLNFTGSTHIFKFLRIPVRANHRNRHLRIGNLVRIRKSRQLFHIFTRPKLISKPIFNLCLRIDCAKTGNHQLHFSRSALCDGFLTCCHILRHNIDSYKRENCTYRSFHLFISISFGDKRAGVPPSPVLSDEADQSP